MDNKTKFWLIAAFSLILIGCITAGGVLSMLNWDFTKLSTAKLETNQYAITEDFQNISIETDTADIILLPAADSTCAIVCQEYTNCRHSVAISNGTLTIKVSDTRKWYEYIGISFTAPKITLSLPAQTYKMLTVTESTGNIDIPGGFSFETVDIKASTGDIDIENILANNVDLSVSTGKITVSKVACTGDLNIRVSTGKTSVTDVQCKNLISAGDTGSFSAKNLLVTDTMSIERSTGDVKLEGADAAQIYVKTDTGNVTGRLLTDKIFITKTDTGRIDVPKTQSGGLCEIETDTGNIKITIE